jgi:hypothetical protein
MSEPNGRSGSAMITFSLQKQKQCCAESKWEFNSIYLLVCLQKCRTKCPYVVFPRKKFDFKSSKIHLECFALKKNIFANFTKKCTVVKGFLQTVLHIQKKARLLPRNLSNISWKYETDISAKRHLSNYRAFQHKILTFVKYFDYENSSVFEMDGRILVLPLSPEHEARHAQHILLQVSCNKNMAKMSIIFYVFGNLFSH